MPKFDVYLVAVASTVVRVEAEDQDAAYEAAYDRALPHASFDAGYDLGEWELHSNIFPATGRFEDDIVEVEE